MHKLKETVLDAKKYAHEMAEKDMSLDDFIKFGQLLEAVESSEEFMEEVEKNGGYKEESLNVAYLNDEMEGTENYYALYTKTADPKLKEMAASELSHAKYWFEKASEAGDLTEEQATAVKRDIMAWGQKLG